MIPQDILDKYGVATLDEWICGMDPPGTDEDVRSITIGYYKEFLSLTDYEVIKSQEDIIERMASATPLNFIIRFIEIIQGWSGLKELVTYRAKARSEIERLEE